MAPGVIFLKPASGKQKIGFGLANPVHEFGFPGTCWCKMKMRSGEASHSTCKIVL
jgi:hypothetical protein